MKNQKLLTGGIVALGLCVAGCSGDETRPEMTMNPGLSAEVRPDTPNNGLQFNFEPGDVVETFASPSAKILVHYTRNGVNAVPAQDSDMSGVPDFVEEVAGVYDDVLAYYVSLGFRPPRSDEGIPDNGGDGKFDVYLVDFAGIGDGVFQVDTCDAVKTSQCSGYMVQENDYKGYGYPSTLVANRILGSHEFFHGVQAAYDRDQGNVFAEGTAVWATESFDPSLNDFEGFIDGYLHDTGRSLDVDLAVPVDSFTYGAAIFFQFLEEKYGAGTVKDLVDRTEDGAFGETDPQWLSVLGKTLDVQAKATFPDAFVEFATWNLYLGSKYDAARSYKNGANYPEVNLTGVSAPYTEHMRLFYASSQYYVTLPKDRVKMTAALTSPDPSSPDTSDVALLLVAARQGKYDPVVRVADVRAGTEEIDTNGADSFVAVAINTAISGNSRRPTLCIGSPAEVADCKKAVEGTGSGGAGGAGGGAGAGGEGGISINPEKPSGCDCQLGGKEAGAEWIPLAGLGILIQRRLRRRNRNAASKPA